MILQFWFLSQLKHPARARWVSGLALTATLPKMLTTQQKWELMKQEVRIV